MKSRLKDMKFEDTFNEVNDQSLSEMLMAEAQASPSPLSCQVIIRNSGFAHLQCSSWRSLQGYSVLPPAPYIAAKSQAKFLWHSEQQDIKIAVKYRYGNYSEEAISLFLYAHITLTHPNTFLVKMLHGEGLPLEHLTTLEQSLQPQAQLAEVHYKGYHCVATLSESKTAVLIVDLWSDYG